MTTATVGGIWNYTIDLCKALQFYDTEIHLMAMGSLVNSEQQQQLEQLKGINFYESNYKVEWMENPWEDISMAKQWISSVYSKVNPDIIHFNTFGHVAGDWDCPVVSVFHFCLQTRWSAITGKTSTPDDLKRYRKAVKEALTSACVIVAPTAAILKDAEKIYPVLKHKHKEVIYNGRDTPEFSITEKEPGILTAGRKINDAKNICLLTDVADDLNWPVYIAGTHNCPEEDEDNEAKNINYLGRLPSKVLQDYMKKASLFVMPAKYEPFGLAVLEAAKAGCALALGDIPTFREIWGDAAVYFNPESADEAAAVLQKLTTDHAFREEKARKALERSKKFTVEKMAGSYINLYIDLIESRKIAINA
ncbi:glycosyltransferase [Flavobacterium sp. MK4S-17]|uniref:glycosyltransferase n=1 Tax=Flavobacterium sp. MK4S-17 TaxID=2543737 RepID=UPI001356A810|nr:glycosyltransferase [Flavobacterium sp. MK4S-17]